MFLRLAFDGTDSAHHESNKATRNVFVEWTPQLDPVGKTKVRKYINCRWRALYQDRYPLRNKCPTVVANEGGERDRRTLCLISDVTGVWGCRSGQVSKS